MGAIEGTGFNGQHNTKVITSKRVKPLDDEAKRQMEIRRKIEDLGNDMKLDREFREIWELI